MNCSDCSAPCCRDVLYLTSREYNRLHKKNATFKFTQIGDIFILNPCPFLADNRCTIYEDRPLACKRYPLNVQFREKAVLLVLHFKCPQIPQSASGEQLLSRGDLERTGITLEEYQQMLLANLILDAEMGFAWRNFTLKERNKMRIFEVKTTQTNPGRDTIIVAIPIEEYSNLVQTVEDILIKNPNSSYSQVSQQVSKLLPPNFVP